jgi:hypothetical protein
MLRFIFLHLVRNPLFLVTYSICFFIPSFKPHASFLSEEDTARAIASGKSLIRFGDGEIYLMNYGSIHYQAFSQKLRRYFFEIIRSYTISSPYILAINEHVMTKSNRALRAHGQLRGWLPMKVYYLLSFPKKVSYSDASLFYYDRAFEKYIEPYLLDKHVIIMTRREQVERLKSCNLPYRNISYVVTPDFQSFDSYEDIKKELEEILAHDESGVTPVVLAGFSVAGKVLAYEFSKKGIQVLDIGVGIELIHTGKHLEHMLMPK